MAEESGSIFESLGLKEERITRLLPLGLGAAYIVGFLIVGLQLAGYGASPLELVKIQYLAAGFWFGLVVLLYWVLIALVRMLYVGIITKHFRTPRAPRYIKIVCAVVTVSSFVGNGLIPVRPFHMALFAVWTRFLAGTILNLGLLDIGTQVYFLAKEARQKDEKRTIIFWAAWIFTCLAVSTGAFALFYSVETFARNVYPNIPFSLGGGKPRQVVFWLDSSANLFLKRDGNNPYTVQYELLVENENSLVVISPNAGEQAIQFDRKSVGAMVVLGKRTGPAHFESNVKESAP